MDGYQVFAQRGSLNQSHRTANRAEPQHRTTGAASARPNRFSPTPTPLASGYFQNLSARPLGNLWSFRRSASPRDPGHGLHRIGGDAAALLANPETGTRGTPYAGFMTGMIRCSPMRLNA